MDPITIDCNRAEKAVSSLPGEQQQGYQPKTLTSYNHPRTIYLPLFPREAIGPNDPLLEGGWGG